MVYQILLTLRLVRKNQPKWVGARGVPDSWHPMCRSRKACLSRQGHMHSMRDHRNRILVPEPLRAPPVTYGPEVLPRRTVSW